MISKSDREAAAQIIAQRIYGSKLEDLEGVQMDNCRDIVTEISELPSAKSVPSERVYASDIDPTAGADPNFKWDGDG
jgi:hypothetical protein